MTTDNQDIDVWVSFRKGDKEAFAAMFRRYYETLFRYGSKFTPDAELLEDCIQELFIEIWQARSPAPVKSIKAYLLKSLKYKLLKVFRQKGRRRSLHITGEIPFEWSHEQFLIAREEDEDKRRRILDALARLSNRQKEIIYLKYYQNLSYEEVSEIMNINYQVARNLLYQAIRSLRGLLTGILLSIVTFAPPSAHARAEKVYYNPKISDL